MESLLIRVKKLIPAPILSAFRPPYHYVLAFLGMLKNRMPCKDLVVIGVTGTKGKSSTVEIIHHILKETGHKTALLSTIRFALPTKTEPNLFKMTMPGRFFVQNFLRKAAHAGATHVVLEMTSEGVKQYRHKFINLDALVFTNLSPEHIESHGSFENYRDAKLKLRDAVSTSKKKSRIIVSNLDDEHGNLFLDAHVENKIGYGLGDVTQVIDNPSISFAYKNVSFSSPLHGNFNVYNLLASIKLTEALGISLEDIRNAIQTLRVIPGRVEYVDKGQDFDVVVDYAHTIDSLKQFYDAFPNKEKICVLGNTGGGRDTWKRPGMARVAEEACKHVILTNEDPYDEDPKRIVNEMAKAMSKKPEIVLDRRKAIARACSLAKSGQSVLISGKGTDPYIMGKDGSKEPWSDRRVAEEELEKMLRT